MRLLFILVYCAGVLSSLNISSTTPCSNEPCVFGTCTLDPSKMNGFSCICDSRFKGALCDEDLDECMTQNCSGVGTCINNDLTGRVDYQKQLGFVCACHEGRAGISCEIVVNLCNLYQETGRGPFCLNGGMCNATKCTCRDGWAGNRCERAVPTTHDFTASGCVNTPHSASWAKNNFGDGKCNLDLNSEACFFDGFDCINRTTTEGETRPASCFHNNETKRNLCARSYGDDKCRPECNVPECGFDGGDCLGNKSVGYDAHIAVLFYEDPYTVVLLLRKIMFELGRVMYNAHVRVAADHNGLMIFEWNVFSRNDSLGERIPTDDKRLFAIQQNFSNSGTLVFFNIDLHGCENANSRSNNMNPLEVDSSITNCFESEELAARFLSIEMSQSGNSAIGRGLRVKAVLPANTFKFPWRHVPIWVIITIVLGLLIILSISVILFVYCKCRKEVKFAPHVWPSTDGNLEYSEALSTPNTPNCVYDCPDRGFFNNNVNVSSMYPSLDHSGALSEAVRRGDVVTVRSMIANKISFSGQKDRHGLGLLHHAIALNDATMLKTLLFETEPGQIEVFERNAMGQSPLVYAACIGHPQLECFILIVEAIAKRRNSTTTLPKSSPARGREHSTASLLSGEQDEQWALCDARGRSAMHYAAENNLPQLIYSLSAYGSDVDLMDSMGDAPLHIATRGGHSSAVVALLDCRAVRIARDADGLIPLKIAENRGFVEIAEILRCRLPGSVHHSLRKIKRRRATGISESSSRLASSDGYYSLESGQRMVNKSGCERGDALNLITPLANGPPANITPVRRMSTPTGDVTPLSRPFFISELDMTKESEYGSVRYGSVIRPSILTPPQVIEEEVKRSYTMPSLLIEGQGADSQHLNEVKKSSYSKVLYNQLNTPVRQSAHELHYASTPLSPVVPQDPPMSTFKPPI